LIGHQLKDLSPDLARIGNRNGAFPLPHGRGELVKAGDCPDPRETLGRKANEIYVPDHHIDSIKVMTRDFR
jgi:error-prone DNA polymerase